MASTNNYVRLRTRDLSGSRLRCLLLTHQPRQSVARLLTSLVQPHAVVSADDFWMPDGFRHPDEARLGDADQFLKKQWQALAHWWLARGRGNMPNWDIASTCTIEGRRGLILVEAKAHRRELGEDAKPAGNPENEQSIRAALAAASSALSHIRPGFVLDADRHYQLSNRFAWAWKIANLGIPVVLVYLAFLNAEDMAVKDEVFCSLHHWSSFLRDYAGGVVPTDVWDSPLDTGPALIFPLIRALESRWLVAPAAGGAS